MLEDNIDYYEDDEFIKRKSNCTIFLGFTSNIVSSGVRETIRFLVQHKMVNAQSIKKSLEKISYKSSLIAL